MYIEWRLLIQLLVQKLLSIICSIPLTLLVLCNILNWCCCCLSPWKVGPTSGQATNQLTSCWDTWWVSYWERICCCSVSVNSELPKAAATSDIVVASSPSQVNLLLHRWDKSRNWALCVLQIILAMSFDEFFIDRWPGCQVQRGWEFNSLHEIKVKIHNSSIC